MTKQQAFLSATFADFLEGKKFSIDNHPYKPFDSGWSLGVFMVWGKVNEACPLIWRADFFCGSTVPEGGDLPDRFFNLEGMEISESEANKIAEGWVVETQPEREERQRIQHEKCTAEKALREQEQRSVVNFINNWLATESAYFVPKYWALKKAAVVIYQNWVEKNVSPRFYDNKHMGWEPVFRRIKITQELIDRGVELRAIERKCNAWGGKGYYVPDYTQPEPYELFDQAGNSATTPCEGYMCRMVLIHGWTCGSTGGAMQPATDRMSLDDYPTNDSIQEGDLLVRMDYDEPKSYSIHVSGWKVGNFPFATRELAIEFYDVVVAAENGFVSWSNAWKPEPVIYGYWHNVVLYQNKPTTEDYRTEKTSSSVCQLSEPNNWGSRDRKSMVVGSFEYYTLWNQQIDVLVERALTGK